MLSAVAVGFLSLALSWASGDDMSEATPKKPPQGSEVTLIGNVRVSWSKLAKREGRLLINEGEANEIIYHISDRTSEGKRCLRSMKNKRVEATGKVAARDGKKWLTVRECRQIKELTPEQETGHTQKKTTDSENETTGTGVAR